MINKTIYIDMDGVLADFDGEVISRMIIGRGFTNFKITILDFHKQHTDFILH